MPNFGESSDISRPAAPAALTASMKPASEASSQTNKAKVSHVQGLHFQVTKAGEEGEVMLDQLADLIKHVEDHHQYALKQRIVPLLQCGCDACERYIQARNLLLAVFKKPEVLVKAA
jgi:hypothetical protein